MDKIAGRCLDKDMEIIGRAFLWAIILAIVLAFVLAVGTILAMLWSVSPAIPVALFVIAYALFM